MYIRNFVNKVYENNKSPSFYYIKIKHILKRI